MNTPLGQDHCNLNLGEFYNLTYLSMCRNSLRGMRWGEKEIPEEVLLITYSVDTGQSSGIYMVCPPLGIAVNRQGTSIGCYQVLKNHVKERKKKCITLQAN